MTINIFAPTPLNKKSCLAPPPPPQREVSWSRSQKHLFGPTPSTRSFVVSLTKPFICSHPLNEKFRGLVAKNTYLVPPPQREVSWSRGQKHLFGPTPSTRSFVVSWPKTFIWCHPLNEKFRGLVAKNFIWCHPLNAKFRGLVAKNTYLVPAPQREVSWSRSQKLYLVPPPQREVSWSRCQNHLFLPTPSTAIR
jgi:hypothetical protein